MKIAHYCMDNPKHMFKGDNLDGIRCPSCYGIVGVKEVPNEVYKQLPYYYELKKYSHNAECLACGHSEKVFHKKGEYQEVRVCPKCNGAFVDVWKLNKYKKQHPNEQTESEIEIIMTNVNKPPKIKLNGKEIDGIIGIEYMYATKDPVLEINGVHDFTVKYCDKETQTIRTVSANKILEG